MRKVVMFIVVAVAAVLVVRLIQNADRRSEQDTVTVTPPPNNGSGPTNSGPLQTSEVPRPADPAVAAVMDEMLAAWDKLNAFSARVETAIPEAAGNEGKTRGQGTYIVQKGDGTLRIRFDLKNELIIKASPENTFVTFEFLLNAIDGQYHYSFLNQPGEHRKAEKKPINYNEILHLGGPHLWKDLVTNNTLSLLPEELKNDRATKVVKAKPKNGTWESTHYFDKATGIRLEMVETNPSGQATLTITVSEINTEPTITEETFMLTLPEGMEFQDQTASTSG